MWKRIKNKQKEENHYYQIHKFDLETIKKAVREFASRAPKGVTARILVKDDHTIDFDLLKPYLKGIPDQPFYMSKETYEIFEEEEKEIPYYLDLIQFAVDRYVQMYNKLPITPGDPYLKVNYLLLQKNNLIHERPTIDLYITEDEYLLTHKKPK
ncbi:MAG TPA: DUF3939 domain-containing protein [Bacillus bacterium]|nr:DUF3939 domain-containing protein [Bacillus sp. (in: firmicutes)]